MSQKKLRAWPNLDTSVCLQKNEAFDNIQVNDKETMNCFDQDEFVFDGIWMND